ncbi:DUF6599 family protein [candidate division KSB1 bacterium]
MKLRYFFTFLLIVMIFISFCGDGSNNSDNILSVLPETGETGDWKISDDAQVFKRDELFEFINGGAEIYLEYGFKQAAGQSFENSNGKSMNLELYQMTDNASAYGMYSFKISEKGKPVDIGDAGVLDDYYLNVWKGDYVITLIGFDSEKETLDGLVKIAEVIAGKIEVSGEKPDIAERFQDKFSSSQHIKYIEGGLALFNIYEYAPGNIFNVKKGLYGKYDSERILIFEYDNETLCNEKYKNSADFFKNSGDFTDFSKDGSNMFVIDKKQDPVFINSASNYIIIVIGTEKVKAEKIAQSFKERIH